VAGQQGFRAAARVWRGSLHGENRLVKRKGPPPLAVGGGEVRAVAARVRLYPFEPSIALFDRLLRKISLNRLNFRDSLIFIFILLKKDFEPPLTLNPLNFVLALFSPSLFVKPYF
jgi:hypothetical protein